MKNTYQIITITIVFFLLVLGCNNQGQNSMPASRQNSTPIPTPENYSIVKSADISILYHSNEVRADDKYKGKIFFIVGEVSDIGKTITGAPYVILKGDPIPKIPIDIQVIFERSEEKKIAKLGKGDIIKAKAECDGLTLGNVILSDAELR